MSSPTPPSTFVGRRSGRRIFGAGALLGLWAATVVSTSVVAPAPALADRAVSPQSGSFTISGAGFGHGWGMSQYGAYGAAKRGLTWREILAFYYPKTTLVTQAPTATIKVWITADNDGDLRVRPAAGLAVSAGGKSLTLPTGAAYGSWRISRSGEGYRLAYRKGSGSWTTYRTTLGPTTWTVSNTAKIVQLIMPSGSVREYRGTLALVKRGGGGRTVNRLPMEDYVKSVVPSEMPTSWLPAAVSTQAVAARTYAARLQASASRSAGYDLCDTVDCQVYSGLAVTGNGWRTVFETRNGNAAVKATARTIVRYGSTIALTQFASSNGGQTTNGDYPYLTAHADPYDGVITSQAWRRTISAGSIARVWPSLGTVRQVQVAARDGYGRWGGRVRTLKLIGSLRTITVSGTSFQYTFGLRSNYFTVVGGTTPAPAPVTVKPGREYASFPRSYHSGSRADLLVVDADGQAVRYPVRAGTVSKGTVIASGLGSFTHVVNAGDWNGDGFQDVIVRTAGERLLLRRGSASGALAAGVDMGLRSNHRSVTSVGDVNGDAHPDLVVINTRGDAYLVYGNGRTGFTHYTRIARGWDERDWLRGPGDLDGDGRVDIVSKVGGTLYLHRGTKGGFAAPVSLGRGWDDLAAITSVGDFDGDSKADIVARTRSGVLRLYRGDGRGHLLSPTTVGGSFTGTRFVV